MLGNIVVSMFAEARRDPKVAELLHAFSGKRKKQVVDAIAGHCAGFHYLDVAAPFTWQQVVGREALVDSVDIDARNGFYAEVQHLISEDPPWLFLYTASSAWGVNSDIGVFEVLPDDQLATSQISWSK